MLLRCLTIATMSLGYLSVQALSSTETRVQRLAANSALEEAEIINFINLRKMAVTAKRQALQTAHPPIPTLLARVERLEKSGKNKIRLAENHKTPAKKTRNQVKANTIEQIVVQKTFVRLAYMPTSFHPNKTAADYRREEKKRIAARIAVARKNALNRKKAESKAKVKLANIENEALKKHQNAVYDETAGFFKPQKKARLKPKYSLGAYKKKAPIVKNKKKAKKYRRTRYRAVNPYKMLIGMQ